nr:hypothetical protein L203_00122 [Cryptococcus depauperatus CBS 7841]
MEADPLYRVKQLFHQASYQACISETSELPHTPSDDLSSLHRALYIARCHLALTPPAPTAAHSVLAPFLSLNPAPISARSVAAFSSFLEADADEKEQRVEEIRDLVLEVEGGDESEESTVRIIAASVFILIGEKEEAVATLTEGAAKQDLECIALLVQLLLTINRRDIALSVYSSAKKINSDSMLVQAMEAWIGLRTGAQPLEQAHFYYDELFNLPGTRTASLLASHGATHYLRGNIDEAKADVAQASQEPDGKSPDVLALGTSLNVPGFYEQVMELANVAPTHPYILDLAEKSKLFAEAAAKFSVKA